MSRCTNCGQFAGEGHTCPEWANPDTSRTCDLEGCEEVLTSDQDRFCSQDHYHEWLRSQPEETRGCAREGCENRHTNEKYCSTECQIDAKRKTEEEPDLEASQDKYFVTRDADGDPDQVVFSINGRLVRVPFGRWDSICRDYSDYGGGLTQAEVARKHGAPLPLVKRALSAYGHYHASPPMARERLAEASDLEPLFSEAIETQEQQFLVELERRQERKIEREWKEMKKKLAEEERHKDAAKEIVDGLTIHVPESPDPEPSSGGIIAHIPTTDVHVGLYVWGEEGFGENYDTDIACERLVSHGQEAARWLAEKGGARVVYRSDLGDFLQADESGETEHGTHVGLDTRGGRVWSKGLEALLENITTIHAEADRTVVKLQRGNHDGPDTIKLKHSVAMALKDVNGIEVDLSPHPFGSFRVGQTQHVLDHGYRINRIAWKATAQAEGVARYFDEDFHGAEWIYSWIGDKHNRQVGGELDHHEIVRLEALCEPNDYETELRFNSRPAARLYELDERGRERDSRVLRVDDLERVPEGADVRTA